MKQALVRESAGGTVLTMHERGVHSNSASMPRSAFQGITPTAFCVASIELLLIHPHVVDLHLHRPECVHAHLAAHSRHGMLRIRYWGLSNGTPHSEWSWYWKYLLSSRPTLAICIPLSGLCGCRAHRGIVMSVAAMVAASGL